MRIWLHAASIATLAALITGCGQSTEGNQSGIGTNASSAAEYIPGSTPIRFSWHDQAYYVTFDTVTDIEKRLGIVNGHEVYKIRGIQTKSKIAYRMNGRYYTAIRFGD